MAISLTSDTTSRYEYRYDKRSGVFLGRFPVKRSTSGEAVITKYATNSAPPAPIYGMVAVFAEGGWSMQEDHRRKVAFNKQTRAAGVVQDLGPLADHLTLSKPGLTSRWEGRWVDDANEALTSRRKWLVDRLNTAVDSVLMPVNYPHSEVLSWPNQEARARAYLTNGGLPSPMLEAMANRRGISVNDLCGKILSKAADHELRCASVLSQKHSLKSQINTSSLRQLENFSYCLED